MLRVYLNKNPFYSGGTKPEVVESILSGRSCGRTYMHGKTAPSC